MGVVRRIGRGGDLRTRGTRGLKELNDWKTRRLEDQKTPILPDPLSPKTKNPVDPNRIFII